MMRVLANPCRSASSCVTTRRQRGFILFKLTCQGSIILTGWIDVIIDLILILIQRFWLRKERHFWTSLPYATFKLCIKLLNPRYVIKIGISKQRFSERKWWFLKVRTPLVQGQWHTWFRAHVLARVDLNDFRTERKSPTSDWFLKSLRALVPPKILSSLRKSHPKPEDAHKNRHESIKSNKFLRKL